MICPKCNNVIEEAKMFCPQCGEKLKTEAPTNIMPEKTVSNATSAYCAPAKKKSRKGIIVSLTAVCLVLIIALTAFLSGCFGSSRKSKNGTVSKSSFNHSCVYISDEQIFYYDETVYEIYLLKNGSFELVSDSITDININYDGDYNKITGLYCFEDESLCIINSEGKKVIAEYADEVELSEQY